MKYITKFCSKKIWEDIVYSSDLHIDFKNDLTLSHGYPGKLILYSTLEDKNKSILLQKLILKTLKKSNIDLSLFSGLSGIGYSFLISDKLNHNASKAIDFINKLIIDNFDPIIKKFESNINRSQSFDLIQGVTGIGNYLLSYIEYKDINNIENNECMVVLEKIIRLFIAEQINNNSNFMPWWISNKNQFLDIDKKMYKNGNYNLGMAHGIIGPLSLSLLIYKNNFFPKLKSRIKEMIYSMFDEILYFKREKNNKNYFFPRESPDRLVYPEKEFIYRNGWCYGNSVLAYVFLLGGHIMRDSYIYNEGVNILDFVLDNYDKYLESAIICHGKSGLIMILESIYTNFYKSERLKSIIEELSNSLLKDFSVNCKYGFVDKELNKTKESAGLLEGSSGITLVIDDLLTNSNIKYEWKRIFLIV